ncbi:hypothetical protein RZE82_05195 [Mollicutes bacterium LVI A0039]|nr:hypothetical protein RZE82_05195 [Mollicutes bacterium LVI A0039]
MQKPHKIDYISHTHWDREWYRSSSEFKVRLYATVKKVIETLETNKDFQCFTFDGQYQMIEEVLEVNSDLESRLKKLVEAGRVMIGPWYIQPDMNLVDGESIANNLRIGITTTREKFGTCMNVLWNPDTFFQSGNTPYFVKQFNLDGVYAWRNFAEDNLDDFAFMWKGFDGTSVKTIAFPIGYGYFRYLDTEPKTALDSQLEFINQIKTAYPNASNNLFLMGGSDHATIQENTPQLLDEMNKLTDEYSFVQSTPEQYLENCDFNHIFEGQPISYNGGRIHPGIAGSRMDIKQANLKQQVQIAKVLSPIVAITSAVGGDYDFKLIDNIWKNLLKNQFHDSIYTSSPEKVNEEIYNRYMLNQQMIDELIYLCSRYLVKNSVDHDSTIDEYIVVFNTLPLSRTTDVEAKIKSAYSTIKIVSESEEYDFIYSDGEVDYESQDYSGLKSLAGKYQLDHSSGVEFGEKYEHVVKLLNIDLEPMSYKVLKIEKAEAVNNIQPIGIKSHEISDGLLNVKDYRDFVKLENILDNGDSYNFSTNEGEHSSNLVINWEPKQHQIIGKYTDSDQNILLKVSEIEDKVLIDIELESTKEDNTLSLVFDFKDKINTKTNLHYAHVNNDSFDKFKDLDWKKEKFKEKPLPIYLCSRYVEVNDKLTIISNNVSQYYQNSEQVKFTLLRSFDKMGKIDLPYRPGRASGYVLDTPSSQQKKKFNYRFVVDFKALSCQSVNEVIVQPQSKFILPTINSGNKTVPSSYSLLSIDNPNVLFETLKVDAFGRYVLRCSNPTLTTQVVEVNGNFKVYSSNLLEECKESNPNNKFTVNSNSATTVLIERI